MDRTTTVQQLQQRGITADMATLMVRGAAQLGHSAPVAGVHVVVSGSTFTVVDGELPHEDA